MMSDSPKWPSQDADVALLKDAAEKLSEHFDSVMIFATRYESNLDGGTINVHWGEGNWFARYGQIMTWLVKQDEQTRIDVRKDER